MASQNRPEPIAVFEEKIRNRFPSADVAIDAPSKPNGSWFIDVKSQGHALTIEWRQDRGFGLATNASNGGYGEGVDETYDDLDKAFRRVVDLLVGRINTVGPESVRLRELRVRRGISQVKLAELLQVQQGAVSKLENRKDSLLSTLKALIGAMGGELKVVATFPDGMEAELQLEDDLIIQSPAEAQHSLLVR